MAQQIYLAAILEREGKLLLRRKRGAEMWSLPGGDLLPEHPDAEGGMAAILAAIGVTVEGIDEAFYDTFFVPAGEGHTVYNLFATSAWEREVVQHDFAEESWHEPGAIASLAMADHERDGVLQAFGLAERPDESAAILDALQGGTPRPTPPPAPKASPPPAPSPPATTPSSPFPSRREAGRDVLRTLSGGADPEARHTGLRANSPELADNIVDFALGEVWGSDRLDRRTRSLEVVAMLAALTGRPAQLRSHINGAINHGATPEEIVETLRMVAVYAGFPAALTAWPVMEEVFAERGIPRPERGP